MGPVWYGMELVAGPSTRDLSIPRGAKRVAAFVRALRLRVQSRAAKVKREREKRKEVWEQGMRTRTGGKDKP